MPDTLSRSPLLSASRRLWDGQRVGLLGGSFNPAHDGHRHISLAALRHLRLDAVWWMVSPQNPLKSSAGMASQGKRLESARRIANHPHIHVTDIESALRTRYTVDTLGALVQRLPDTHFVWLMGSDNLRQFHRWKNWRTIFDLMPVCVISRPPAGDILRASPAATYARRFFCPADTAPDLAEQKAPALLVLPTPLNALSSTDLRAAGIWT